MKADLNPTLRLDAFAILNRAVEEGVTYGMNRAHKHNDAPSRELIADEIERAVMANLCEVLSFEIEVDGDEDSFEN